jgi:hypothetical protein
LKTGRDLTALSALLYAELDRANPGQGYDTKAAEWKRAAEAIGR